MKVNLFLTNLNEDWYDTVDEMGNEISSITISPYSSRNAKVKIKIPNDSSINPGTEVSKFSFVIVLK